MRLHLFEDGMKSTWYCFNTGSRVHATLLADAGDDDDLSSKLFKLPFRLEGLEKPISISR